MCSSVTGTVEECGHHWFAKSPTECQFCRSERLTYKEYPLRHERYMVEGHADGAVHFPDLRSLIEIKSIGIRTLAFEAPRLYQRYLDGQSGRGHLAMTSPTPSPATCARASCTCGWRGLPTSRSCSSTSPSSTSRPRSSWSSTTRTSSLPLLEMAKEVSQCVRTGYVPDRPDWATGPDGKVCASCPYRNYVLEYR